jgi:hypothetical protein
MGVGRGGRAAFGWLQIGRLSILSGVVQFDDPACFLLGGVHDAGIKRPRINVQADRTVPELPRIQNAMHWIVGINRARVGGIHFNGIGGTEFTLALINVLRDQMKIFYQQPADGHQHPAVLVAMIVYRTGLPDFPANRDELVERRLVDEVARVMLPVPNEIWRKSFGRNCGALEKGEYIPGLIKRRCGKFMQLGNEIIEGNCLGNNLGCHFYLALPDSIVRDGRWGGPGGPPLHGPRLHASFASCDRLGSANRTLLQEHAVPIGIEPVFLRYGMLIRGEHAVLTAKGADQHQQSRLREVEIGEQCRDHAKLKTRVDE